MRKPLQPQTKITQNIVIDRLISELGGTSLVYLAQNGHYNVIIKEYFPSDINNSEYMLYRSKNNKCIETNISDENILAKLKKEKKRFIEQAQKTELAINSPTSSTMGNDYSSIYFFECMDITEDVRQTPGFENTLSVYLLFACKNGMTLDNYIKYISKNGHISLEQNLYITKSILLTLRYLHEERKMLHLDIKPDNLFFSTDIKEPERTLCFLLDLEGIQPIGKKIDILSVSNDFAPPEIRKMFELKQLLKTNPNDCELHGQYSVLATHIDTYSDIYSVAACMYEMLMFDNPDYLRRWRECIKVAEEPQKLLKLLQKDVNYKLNEEYPYLIEKITHMLLKGLYCLEKNSTLFSKKLSEFRYCSCTEFINDINDTFDIINNQGFNEEVLLRHSYDMFSENYYFRKNAAKQQDSTTLINNDNLYKQDWFANI